MIGIKSKNLLISSQNLLLNMHKGKKEKEILLLFNGFRTSVK